MKKSGIQLGLLITAILCLTALTGIQVNWILREARLQEHEFNENVKVAMEKIERTLSPFLNKDYSEKFYNTCPKVLYGLQQAIDLDSLISNELKSSGINLAYEYGIVNFRLGNYSSSRNEKAVTANLADGLRDSGYQLKINFPKKSDFILAQIGYAFITSIILIILAIASFMLIFTYFRRERDLTYQIKDFVNNMTHEFKTPLTNIAFANNMISKNKNVKDDEKLSSYSRIIDIEQRKLNDRVEQLLSTSRAPHLETNNIEDINIADMVEDSILSFSNALEQKEGKINLIKSGGDFSARYDPVQIQIILSNLIDNAIKYSNTKPEIEISLKALEKTIIIDISDNGIGISKDDQRYIFSNYFRVSTGDKHDTKGFGIGLYHVKNIIEKMGGKIKVSSSRNKGTKFTIHMPKHQDTNE